LIIEDRLFKNNCSKINERKKKQNQHKMSQPNTSGDGGGGGGDNVGFTPSERGSSSAVLAVAVEVVS
jgi:hypothetical protein